MEATAEKKAALKVGQTVVYRVTEYSSPRVGKLHGKNTYPEFTAGCWQVRDDLDGRLYAIDPAKHAKVRLADKGDIERHYQYRKDDRARELRVEAVAATEQPTVKPSATTGMGASAAQEIEKEVRHGKQ